MQEIFNTVKDSFLSFFPYFILCLILYAAIELFLYKKRNSKKNEADPLGLSKTDEQLHRDLEAVKEKFGKGDKPAEVDAVTAIYIAPNWDKYNLFGSENGTVLFEKIKELGDTVDVLPLEEEKKELIEEKQKWITLEDGTSRVISETGYVDFKDGRIIGTKVFDQENDAPKKAPKQKKKEDRPVASKQEKAAEIKKVEEVFAEEDEEENQIEEKVIQPTYKIKPPSPFDGGMPQVVKVEDEKPLAKPETKMQEEVSLPKEEVLIQEETSSEIITPAQEVLSPALLAQEISGTKKRTPPASKISDYDLQYVFEGYQDFCRNIFLSECDSNLAQRLQKYIHFVAQHQFVFYDKDETKMYVFVDTFMLSLARMIKAENRKSFLSTFYNDGIFNLDSLSAFVEKLSARISLVCDSDEPYLMAWKNQGKSSFVLSRGLKAKKTFCGQFVIFNFRKESAYYLGDLKKNEENICEVISLKASEFDAIKGIKLKPKNFEEIKQNVL